LAESTQARVADQTASPGRQPSLPTSDDEIVEFFTNQSRGVYYYAYTLTGGDAATAEDLVQDAFLAAAKAWSQVRTMDHPELWLRAIIRHKAVDSFRRTRREVLAAAPPDSATAPDTATEVVSKDLINQVMRMIEQLPPTSSRVLYLRYREGWEISEIADCLRIDPSTVRSHLHHGRERLRKLVGNLLEDSDARHFCR
jgi:RNA polymerase sigma-70 factor (ECF subfamily)